MGDLPRCASCDLEIPFNREGNQCKKSTVLSSWDIHSKPEEIPVCQALSTIFENTPLLKKYSLKESSIATNVFGPLEVCIPCAKSLTMLYNSFMEFIHLCRKRSQVTRALRQIHQLRQKNFVEIPKIPRAKTVGGSHYKFQGGSTMTMMENGALEDPVKTEPPDIEKESEKFMEIPEEEIKVETAFIKVDEPRRSSRSKSDSNDNDNQCGIVENSEQEDSEGSEFHVEEEDLENDTESEEYESDSDDTITMPMSNKGGQRMCGYCDKLMYRLQTLEKHIQGSHQNSELLIKCHYPNCILVFKNDEDFKKHENLDHQFPQSRNKLKENRNNRGRPPKKLEDGSFYYDRGIFNTEENAQNPIQQSKFKETRRCGYCKRLFARMHNLKMHTEGSHLTTEYNLQCIYPTCEEQFKSDTDFKIHLDYSHGGEIPGALIAEEMKKSLRDRSTRISHVSLDRKLICLEVNCGRIFETPSELQEHRQKEHGQEERSSCPVCSTKLLERFLLRHLNRFHHVRIDYLERDGMRGKWPEKKKVCCQKCGLMVRVGYYYRLHLRNHRRKELGSMEDMEQCPTCMKRLDKKTFPFHIAKHNKEQAPFKCEQCGRGYYDKRAMAMHVIAVHKKIRYPCDQCDHIAKLPDYLRKHKIAKHSTGERRKFLCDECGQSYTCKASLKRHVLTQHNLKNLKIKNVKSQRRLKNTRDNNHNDE